jgi:hypothetical protein
MTRQQTTVTWSQVACFPTNKHHRAKSILGEALVIVTATISNCAPCTVEVVEGRIRGIERNCAKEAHQLEAAHVRKIIPDEDSSVAVLVIQFYAFKCILNMNDDEQRHSFLVLIEG